MFEDVVKRANKDIYGTIKIEEKEYKGGSMKRVGTLLDKVWRVFKRDLLAEVKKNRKPARANGLPEE